MPRFPPQFVCALRRVVIAFVVVTMGASAQSNDECLICHSEPSLTMTKRGRTVPLFVDEPKFTSSAHGILECVTCHEGFDPGSLPHARRITPVNCTSCHNGDMVEKYQKSVHGLPGKKGLPNASCADCHSNHEVVKLSDQETETRKTFAASTCGKCHGDVYKRYMDSDHGRALAGGIKGAPSCIDCHGEHTVVSPYAEDAPTGRQHEATMCLSCHLDNPDVRAQVGPSAGFIASYELSVHGMALKSGNDAAATCSDCHGSHEMKKGSNPTSAVHKKNISATCGRCHGDVQEEFETSIHGTALARGVLASATCTDCHGEHNILSPKDLRATVSPRNVSAEVCSPCHTSLRLTEKYGLSGNRFRTFEDSYHGLAGRGGSVAVANCASCHGVHDIKPSWDATSRVHKDNLAATCGTCHPGATDAFAKGSVHVIARGGEEPLLHFVATAYIILIITIIGGMVVHNVADFIKKAKRQLLIRRGVIPQAHSRTRHRLYLRMSLSERFQHGSLMVSFILLVITGFMLRYPDAWWVVPIRDLSPAVFDLRSLMHRIAGVVMVVASLYHLYYVFFIPRGKQLLRDLLPVRQDIYDAIGVVKYNFGFAQSKPRLGRFSYVEKSEYWALVWGTAVMAITGFILWFDNTFMNLLTKLGWDVARTVHFYEAWLATLAILVWHIYYVIFNPDVYPMNVAWIKGTLTEEEMEHEHPLELEHIRERERQMELAEKNAVQEETGGSGQPRGSNHEDDTPVDRDTATKRRKP
jgi:formate dehydrogenase gamma subunit